MKLADKMIFTTTSRVHTKLAAWSVVQTDGCALETERRLRYQSALSMGERTIGQRFSTGHRESELTFLLLPQSYGDVAPSYASINLNAGEDEGVVKWTGAALYMGKQAVPTRCLSVN